MKILLTAFALLASATTAWAAPFYAVSGKYVRLLPVYAINPDCSPVGHIEVRIIQAPQHGRAVVSRKAGFTNFPESNIRSACNRRRVPTTEIGYVSQRGYTGPDQVAVEIIYPFGVMRRGSAYIIVK